jgi:hypothetical protein
MQTTISGYQVKVEHNGIPYTIYTKTGIRGINVPCLAWYNAGWHVTVKGVEIPIKMVLCDLKIVAAKDNLAVKRLS